MKVKASMSQVQKQGSGEDQTEQILAVESEIDEKVKLDLKIS